MKAIDFLSKRVEQSSPETDLAQTHLEFLRLTLEKKVTNGSCLKSKSFSQVSERVRKREGGAMAKATFEASMAALEQLQAPPAEILEEAAKILNIDLGHTLRRSSTEILFQGRPRSQGFKEQWVLRWLLKKLNASDSKVNHPAADQSQGRCEWFQEEITSPVF
jgi:hypothetical protein